MDEARRRALDMAAERYDGAKRRARLAAIDAEDAWSEMFRLAGDSTDLLDEALQRIASRRDK